MKKNCIALSFRLDKSANEHIDILADEWRCSKTRAVEMALEVAVNSLGAEIPVERVAPTQGKPDINDLRNLISGIENRPPTPITPVAPSVPLSYADRRQIERDEHFAKVAAKDKLARLLDRGDVEYD